jgi:hypothetical protein
MANQEAVLTLHFLIEKRVSHVRKCLRLAQDRITTFLPNGTIDTKGPYASPLSTFFTLHYSSYWSRILWSFLINRSLEGHQYRLVIQLVSMLALVS